jgi:hypothetical protein
VNARTSTTNFQIRLVAITLLQLLLAGVLPVCAEESGSLTTSDGPEQQTILAAATADSASVATAEITTDAEPTLSNIEQQIRAYDRKIFLELVNLAEYNVRYQQTVNHYARWRKIFYPAAQEAGYACFLGFSISDISQRINGWNNPGRISQSTSKRALSAATVGTLIGGTSSLVELTANGVEALRAKQKGFSNRQSVNFVQTTVKRVNDMLASRHALMEQGHITGPHRELLELKEELLNYERDRLVFEFKRWNVHARGYTWYRNTFYVINATVNFGRFSSTMLGFKSFSDRRYSGGTGPVQITSAVLAGLGPITSTAVGNCIERKQERFLNEKLPIAKCLSDQEAKNKFERLANLLTNSETNSRHAKVAAELIHLREEKLGLDTLIFHEERTIDRIRKVAGQQAITAPLISSLGATSAILSTVGYHAYRQQPIISNRLGVAGGACVIPAEAIALIATPAAAIKTHLYERDLKRKGEHPEQLLANRLKDLESLKERVTSAWQ